MTANKLLIILDPFILLSFSYLHYSGRVRKLHTHKIIVMPSGDIGTYSFINNKEKIHYFFYGYGIFF